jgi:hypothetical protein
MKQRESASQLSWRHEYIIHHSLLGFCSQDFVTVLQSEVRDIFLFFSSSLKYLLLYSRLQGVIEFGNYVIIFITDRSKSKHKIITCLVYCTDFQLASHFDEAQRLKMFENKVLRQTGLFGCMRNSSKKDRILTMSFTMCSPSHTLLE